MEAELTRKWMVLWEEVVAQGDQTRGSDRFSGKAVEDHLIPPTVQHSWTELHQAARNGNLHLVKKLLKQGAAIESR